MQRPSLTLRFFLALAVLALAIVVLMTVAMRWSVRHDMVDYVQRREFARLQPLQELLTDSYRQQGDWQFLRGKPDVLAQLIQASGVTERRRERGAGRGADRERRDRFPLSQVPPGAEQPTQEKRNARDEYARSVPEPPADHDAPGFAPPPPPEHEPDPEFANSVRTSTEPELQPPPFGPTHPPGPMRFEMPPLQQRMQVLDADHQLLVGRQPPTQLESIEQAIQLDDRIIGYLQLQLPPLLNEDLEQRFLASQMRTLLLIAGGALLLALIVAWWLGRNLVQPILSVAGTVRQLAEGELDTRTTVSRGDELGQLARDVDQLATTLTANERLRREVMADVSHEFRTPLALLQSKIEAMQDGVLPSDQQTLATLHDATLRLSRMVDDLYQVALADTGALRLHCQDLDLRPLIDEAVADAGDKIAAAGLKASVAGELRLYCHGDRQRLRQVLDNLLHNSVRYTDAGGEISVQLRRDGDHAQLTIEDTAPGVPTPLQEKLFDRFFRVEHSRSRDAGGSGLGLSVVKAIVQAHAGSVSAHPSRLGGLAIVIRLPLAAMSERPA
ncbi:HAMP domain-containing protein [Permianibacter sp. IMCC34836]|uniref:ATP-binding protein n=1 Tax=Permianibacter fluminis TaxID=2738515 RepID=UPI001552265F|nr:ATP-binding protein [Permianibacter fluminis]NQD38771.1 HAMP domain-containing protein [Permianibacter fluminis]